MEIFRKAGKCLIIFNQRAMSEKGAGKKSIMISLFPKRQQQQKKESGPCGEVHYPNLRDQHTRAATNSNEVDCVCDATRIKHRNLESLHLSDENCVRTTK